MEIPMETDGVTVGVTFMVMELEVVLELPQDKVVVMLQVTICPLVNDALEYVVPLLPTGLSSTIHV